MTAGPQLRDVVYVVTDPGVPAYGAKGCSVHVQEVLRVLAAKALAAGGRVVLIAARLAGPAPAGLEDVETIELGRPRAGSPAAAERALVELDGQAAQVVGGLLGELRTGRSSPVPPLVYQRYGLWSAETLEAARAAGARTVLEVNAPLVDEQRDHRVLVDEAGATALTVRALRAAHLSYAVSSPVGRWAADLAGVEVPTLGNGVDAERFAAASAAPRSASDEVPVVAFAGSFRPWHAPDLLVEAAVRLRESGDPVRLLFIGDGPTRAHVVGAARAQRVEVEDAGAVDPARVPTLLARADIACAPYPAGDAYFSPLKVIEYLGAGLPTVAAGVGDLPDLFRSVDVRSVDPDEPGELLLAAPGDVTALADALRMLVRDPVLRARTGAAGQAAARERFTWTGVVDRVLGLVTERAR